MDKFSYSLGIVMAQNLIRQNLSEFVTTDLVKGIEDAIKGDTLDIDPQEANNIVQAHMQKAVMAQNKPTIEEGAKFLEANAKRAEVTVLESGLQYEILKEGSGAKPSSDDKVTTHYHGTLIDGTIFDSSVQRGEPATFPVNGVIKGWIEALQLMKLGAKWKLYVPFNLAYGDQAAGPHIKPFSTLVFEVELLKIN